MNNLLSLIVSFCLLFVASTATAEDQQVFCTEIKGNVCTITSPKRQGFTDAKYSESCFQKAVKNPGVKTFCNEKTELVGIRHSSWLTVETTEQRTSGGEYFVSDGKEVRKDIEAVSTTTTTEKYIFLTFVSRSVFLFFLIISFFYKTTIEYAVKNSLIIIGIASGILTGVLAGGFAGGLAGGFTGVYDGVLAGGLAGGFAGGLAGVLAGGLAGGLGFTASDSLTYLTQLVCFYLLGLVLCEARLYYKKRKLPVGQISQ